MYLTPEKRNRLEGKSSDGFIATCRNVTFQVTDDCPMACTYCVSGDTQILMSDYSTKPITEIAPGDKVLGFDEITPPWTRTKVRKAEVRNVFHRKASVMKVKTEDGNELLITPNHRVLTDRNVWENSTRTFMEIGNLFPGKILYRDPLHEVAAECLPPEEDDKYKQGYLIGLLKGAGTYLFRRRKVYRGYRAYSIRFVAKSREAICRAREYLEYFGFNMTWKEGVEVSPGSGLCEECIESYTKETYDKIRELCAGVYKKHCSESYLKGFLAGIFDACGDINDARVIRLGNDREDIVPEIERCLERLGFSGKVEQSGAKKRVRITGNLNSAAALRFLLLTNPTRACIYQGLFWNYGALRKTKIVSIEELPEKLDVYNIETTTGTYIANGIAVHNCYQTHKGHNKMSKETARKCVDMLFDMYERNDDEFINRDMDAIILDFIGGEPLMAIDIIDYICSYFYDKCIELNHPWMYTWRASMTSNGALYFEPEVQAFLKKFNGRVSFAITLDGPKEIHDACRVYHDGRGNFDDAYAAMKHFNANYYEELGTKVTIAPENLADINKIVRFFVDEGMKIIHANPVYEVEWTVEQAQQYYRELKKMADYLLELNDETNVALFDENLFIPMLEDDQSTYCGGTGKMLAFDPQGLAYPCLRYMESSLGGVVPPLVIGDCGHGLFVTEEQRKLQDELCKITRRTQNTDECYYCPIARGCGECAAYSYMQHKRLGKRSMNICNMHKARSLANVYYWNKYYAMNGIDKKMPLNLPKEEALRFVDEEEYEMLKAL